DLIHSLSGPPMKKLTTLLALLSALMVSACGGGGNSGPAVIVAYGDSLTNDAGQWVTPSELWVEKLKAQIQADGLNEKREITVINAGLGGEDSEAALQRLPGILANYKPTHILLMHGTNDIPPFCPGCPDAITRPNLEAMAALAKDAGADVIMGEFTLKSFGSEMAQNYTNAIVQAAANTKSGYVNLSAGIPYDDTYYQFDGVHFTDAAQELIKNNAAAALFPALR
ncbi:MAG: hypothetical protein KDF54_13365, partial [Hydrogenophaga sp.]|nr:hypothetical protein [Hydrogenophaga sp.]